MAALGIPTVVDAASLAADLTGGRREAVESVCPRGASMVVTPREIDLLVERGARTLAMAVNRALNPSLSQEEISLLTS